MRKLLTLSIATIVLAACSDSNAVTDPATTLTSAAATASGPTASLASATDANAGDKEWQDMGGDEDEDRDPRVKTYRVTITNLTSGQPLSPGVVVTHNRRASLFGLGKRASAGIRAIAEDGDPSVAATALDGARGVYSVITTTAPVGITGGSAFPNSLSFEVTARGNAKLLSLSLMLICTNDGFVGLDAVRLPRGRRAEVYYAAGYDAGTEKNTEVASSIVPPCFGIGPVQGLMGGSDRTPERGRIRPHRGIKGIADLTAAHDWKGPVAKVVVQRIN
jgi:hypothetical protein